MPSYFCADPKVTCRANPVPKKAFEPALTLLPSGAGSDSAAQRIVGSFCKQPVDRPTN